MDHNRRTVEEHLRVALGQLALLARYADLEERCEAEPSLGADVDSHAARARSVLALDAYRRLKAISGVLDAKTSNLELEVA